LSYIGSTPANKIVTSSDMEDGVVSTDKLAANAVTTAKITDGTIAEADIANDAVTADKIANAVNSAIAANTSKTTNATHSGEVTGSGALTIADNVVDEANLKVSNNPTNGYALTAQSGNTGGLTWSSVGGANTPAFEATAPDGQTYSDASTTVIPANSEVFDTDSAYNTSNYRFTPQVAGKYFCYAQISGTGNSDTLRRVLLSIRKNSTDHYQNTNTGGLNFNHISVSQGIVLDLNGSSDYVESTVLIDQGSGTPKSNYARIGAFKLIT